jgi:hypothetical protein
MVTLGEAHYGARKRKWAPERSARMLAFYEEMFDVVPGDKEAAAE